MDLTLVRGDTWNTVFSLKDKNSPSNPNSARDPVDLTGASARLFLRKVAGNGTVALSCTTANTKIVIDGPAGTLTMAVAGTDTSALVGRYNYDLEITFTDSTVLTVIQGVITFLADVTHD